MAKFGVRRKSRVELELVLLGTPVISQKVRGDTEQPGPETSLLRIEVVAPAECCGKGLTRHVVGEGRADPSSDEAVHCGKLLFEASLEGSVIRDPRAGGLP